MQYGCRVYIDAGGLNHCHIFDVARGANGDQTAEGQSVDRSEPDHFIWFGPGETSYVVQGYYCSTDEEYEFKFGALPTNSGIEYNGDKDKLETQKNHIGIIHFQFARVKEMVERRDVGYQHSFLPSRAKDY